MVHRFLRKTAAGLLAALLVLALALPAGAAPQTASPSTWSPHLLAHWFLGGLDALWAQLRPGAGAPGDPSPASAHRAVVDSEGGCHADPNGAPCAGAEGGAHGDPNGVTTTGDGTNSPPVGAEGGGHADPNG